MNTTVNCGLSLQLTHILVNLSITPLWLPILTMTYRYN